MSDIHCIKTSTKNQATIFLVRHGEVSTKGLLCGSTDISLSENGLKQLHLRGASLPPIELCFSSPLSRCALFAQQFRTKQQQRMQLAPKLQIKEALQEIHFGDWDGKPYENLWKKNSSSNISLGDFWQNPYQHTPPNGESMIEFAKRVNGIWQEILVASQGKNTLVVTHAGVIKQMIAEVIGLPMASSSHLSTINIPYAGMVRVDVHYDDIKSNERGNNDDKTDNRYIWPSISF